jgi:diguanylate cyclase (GGDEF)-like protein/PAS domain S-box-containing protein
MPVCTCEVENVPPGGFALTGGFCFGALEAAKESVCVFDAQWVCCYANPAARALSGFSDQELRQLTFDALLPSDTPVSVGGELNKVQRILLSKSGLHLPTTISVSHLACGRHLVLFQGDTLLQRLNRTLRLLRACSKALVCASNEAQLLWDLCELIVDHGGYRMAWVGLAQRDADRSVTVAAYAGAYEGYLASLKLSWGDTPVGRGPTGTAIRTGVPQVNQNFAINPVMKPWRDIALARGFHSSIALPLRADGVCLGALTLYSGEADAFTAQEVELLEELARDVGFGVETLRHRALHDQTRLDNQMLAERFNYLSKFANDIILLIDDNGHILEANERALEAYGFSHEEILKMEIGELQVLAGKEQNPVYPSSAGLFQTLHRRKDGSLFPVEQSERLIETGGRRIVQAILRDITEQQRTAQALAASERRYRMLFENMLEGFAYCQLEFENDVAVDFTYLEVNAAFTRLTGLTDVIGKKVSQVIPGIRQSNPELFDVYRRVALSGIPERFEVYIDRLDIWLSITVYSTDPGCFIAVFDNISERKATEARIQYLAHHDILTGLPNRLLGRDRFEQAKAYADRNESKVALLFIDLDNFKTVNDSLGHAQGDELLKAVSYRLTGSLRETDSICRQGGDEFLIILTDVTDTESITFIAAKLLEQVSDVYRLDDLELSISASCGVSVYPDDGYDFDTLYTKADTAMYQAKESGRNACRFFDAQMNVNADERLGLRNALRQALERGEFELYFQPQIDLKTRRVIGAEALIRWNHPVLGMIPPGRFIPVAEDSWLIVPIGEWVLREACQQAVRWQKAGAPELVVAVNLSAVQFRRGNLEAVVISALEASGLPPRLLELELTESILIKNTENMLHTIRRLKALGVRLSIDDFGTGYSSLAYLQRFAVDKVKIDQSFVMDLENNPGNAAIVRAVIQMAQSLGLKTIAEGVEAGWMLEYLENHHCDEAQGYHIGLPMPVQAFIEFVRTANAVC